MEKKRGGASVEYLLWIAAAALVCVGDRALKKHCPKARQALQLVFCLAATALIVFLFYLYGTALVRTADSGVPAADKATLTVLITLADGVFLWVLGLIWQSWLADWTSRRSRRG